MKTSLTLLLFAASLVTSMAQLPPPLFTEEKPNATLIHVFQSNSDNLRFGEPKVTTPDGTMIPTGQYTIKNVKDGSFLFNFNVKNVTFPLTVANGSRTAQVTEATIKTFPKYNIDLITTDTFFCYIRATDNAEVITLLTENLAIMNKCRELDKKLSKNPSLFLIEKYQQEFEKNTNRQQVVLARVSEIRNAGKKVVKDNN